MSVGVVPEPAAPVLVLVLVLVSDMVVFARGAEVYVEDLSLSFEFELENWAPETKRD